MEQLKQNTSLATVIGDVVGSRRSPDRSALHERLSAGLAELNATLRPVVPLRITVADEFQGCFTTLGEALHATLWLRVHVAPLDLRHGVGWGPVAVLGEAPRVEDGPGWWAARAAIEEAKAAASRPGTRLVRTSYRLADGTDGPDPGPVEAALICRDQLVGSVSERSMRLLRGTLEGRTQAELAQSEGVSASAVSQRVRNDGLAVILAADELLRGTR